MRICLVLGGGGAKGYVHVGVLSELVHRGYAIESIVGTSIGALVGAIFAYNFAIGDQGSTRDRQQRAASAVETVFLETDFQSFRDINYFSLLRRGLLKGKRIEEWLITQLLSPNPADGPRGIRFEQLKFPLTIMVTDALTGDSHELNADATPGGFVNEGVRASMSIQGVFRDVSIDVRDGRRIRAWDGGNTGNCRIDVARRLHPDLPVVGVSLTYRGEPRSTEASILSAWQRPKKLYDQALSVLMRQFEHVVYESMPDGARDRVVMLRPALGSADTFSFAIDRAERKSLIENGRTAARQGVRWPIG